MNHRLADDRIVAIRRFFLYPNQRYSLAELARIWGVSLEAVVAMFMDELSLANVDGADPLTFEVDAGVALNTANAHQVFRPIEVEEALGEEFVRARREHWRTIPLTVHLPLVFVDVLAEFSFLPEPASLEARAERLLCEVLKADRILSNMTRDE